MRFAPGGDGALGQCRGLVEAALFMLCAVKRHGNDEPGGRRVGGKLSDGGSEHRAEAAGCGMDALILQGVDSGVRAAVIGSE